MTILDKTARALRRMHATNEKNIPNILMSRLEPRKHFLDGDNAPSVFMTAGNRLDNSFFVDEYGNRNALIKYRIPKEWHRKNVIMNPHYEDYKVDKDPNWMPSYETNALDRKVADVMNGGRAVTYNAPVPNEFIDEICFGPNAERCYDPDVLMKHISNESPDVRDDMWEWNVDFYPIDEDIFKVYGRR